MGYSVAVNSNGQITIPSLLRQTLGLDGGRVYVEQEGEQLVISRERPVREVLAELDAKRSPELKKRIAKDAGKTATEIIDDWAASPDGAKFFEEHYNV